MALRQEEFTRLCDDVDLDRDRALVERCQAGDSAAFGNLYARYYERLLRFCLRRLNDRHEAEDAAQEAFARAWKALPTFAGERRFYPWLTVIAGNICTDTLRRRSRSTPTDDLELSAHQPVGSYGSETSEELVLAAVDGELVNKALDRLSVRHRHVLAMREGSGWTYQQIADHEGVEIGTIETLLWRARQALKREFSVLSESKGAMGGFLVGAGALMRRGFLRMANRAALLVPGGGGGGSGSFRNAFAGVAVTSAAVAAAIITPHAFSSSPKPADPVAASTQATAAIADPPLPLAAAAPAPSGPSDAATSVAGTDGGSTTSPVISALRSTTDGTGQALPKVQPTTDDSPAGPLTDDPSQTIPIAGGLIAPLTDPITAPLAPLTQVAAGVTDSVANTFDGLAGALGLGLTLPQLGGVLSPSGNSTTPGTTTTTTTPSLIGGVANTVTSTLKNLLGAS